MNGVSLDLFPEGWGEARLRKDGALGAPNERGCARLCSAEEKLGVGVALQLLQVSFPDSHSIINLERIDGGRDAAYTTRPHRSQVVDPTIVLLLELAFPPVSKGIILRRSTPETDAAETTQLIPGEVL
jgi:hypothetical protein